MKAIQSLELSRLNHLDALAFCRKVCDIVGAGDSVTAKKCVAELCNSVEAFAVALDESPELISMEIHAADSDVDMAWRGMNAELENHLDHPNESVRDASAAVYEVWCRVADPTELSYEDEYKQLKMVIGQISKVPADVMKNAGVDEWFDALKKRYESFMALWGEKTATDSQRLANQVKKNRATMESCYNEVALFVENWSKFADLDDKFNEIDSEVAKVVSGMNAVIGEYNAMLAERRKNVSDCICNILNDLI